MKIKAACTKTLVMKYILVIFAVLLSSTLLAQEPCYFQELEYCNAVLRGDFYVAETDSGLEIHNEGDCYPLVIFFRHDDGTYIEEFTWVRYYYFVDRESACFWPLEENKPQFDLHNQICFE